MSGNKYFSRTIVLKEKRKESNVGFLEYVFPAAHPGISGTASATQIRLCFQLPSYFSTHV